MEQVAPGVWLLKGYPPYLVNVYLAGDVLIDAGTRWARRRILNQLRGRSLSLVALTHCHPDHQGAALEVCRRYRVPLACHEADVPAMEGRAPMVCGGWKMQLGLPLLAGPPCRVGRILREGDMVAGFRVYHAPGHTPGHVIYYRDADRVAIAGDLLANMHLLTGRPGLREPPPMFSFDPTQNRRSLRILLDLRPRLVCFGHGPPLRDPAQLEAFAARKGGAGMGHD